MPPALAKNFVAQMFTRDLLAVDNLLVLILCCGDLWLNSVGMGVVTGNILRW